VTPDDVALAARASGERGIPPTLADHRAGREIRPKTAGQRALAAAIDSNTLTFAIRARPARARRSWRS